MKSSGGIKMPIIEPKKIKLLSLEGRKVIYIIILAMGLVLSVVDWSISK